VTKIHFFVYIALLLDHAPTTIGFGRSGNGS